MIRKLTKMINYLKDPQLVASIQQFFGVKIYYNSYKKTFREEEKNVYTKFDDNEENYVLTCHSKSINGCDASKQLKTRTKQMNPLEQRTNERTNEHKETLIISNNPNYTITNPFWYYTFVFGTELGDEIFYSTFIPFLFWNIDGAIGQRVVLVWATIMTIGQILKDIICWPRPACPPAVRLQNKWSQEYGMPSTHAMVGLTLPFSVVLFTMNKYIYPFSIGCIMAFLWCVLVSMSRLYLGMHTVLDVLAGLVLAIALMIPLVPLVDLTNSYVVTNFWLVAMLIAISIATIVYYPSSYKWTPTRSDTAMVVSVTAGIHVGAWLNYCTDRGAICGMQVALTRKKNFHLSRSKVAKQSKKMASWSRVQSGFDIDDETINFGTRIIAENNGSLYEACTVATIQSLEKVDQQPNVVASIQYSKICVAIDKSITIFKDETCDEILCNISFPSMIAGYCISKDGVFLIVILTTRILYCLHLSDGKIIFTKTMPDNEGEVIEIFLKEQSEETLIILVTNTGAIYRFSKFYPKALDIAFISNDKVTVAKYIADIQCSQLFKGFTSPEFLNATVDTSSEELSITMVGANSIFTWPNEHYMNFQDVFSFGYKKIKPLHGNSKMLCLRTDNILNMICVNTFLTLKICDGPVFDFSVIQNDDHCEILFLTRSENNYTTCTLRVISYPDFEQKLEIDVSTNTCLLNVLHASDNLFYIEGITTEIGTIDTFRIKTILESIPEIRLARLLRKRQFDAAEAFAKKLNLSMESVYCSKATLLVEQLSPWAKSTSNSVNVDTLINILDKIQNVQYVIECCSKALISDYIQMRRLYSYARQKIVENIKIKNIDDSLNTSLSVINDALYRLETFQMIQDIEADGLLNDDASMKEWIRFSQANLLEECISRLNMGQLKSATLIWTRHLPDLVKHISMQTVQNIFTILPEDVDPSCLWPWLIHFIPTLLSLLPDAINEIISWSLKKLKYLEISHRTTWPEIGTEFAKKFIKLLKFEDNQSVYFHQEYRYQNSLLKQFMILFQALSDIQQLKIVHRLRVPLDVYIDSPVEAIYMLLDKIHIDQISNFANTFLKQYIFNNNLQNDTVFCTYIQKTIENSYSWWFNEEAAWEKRVVIIIDLIHNIEKRLEQTLIVLRKAPVPWSSIIANLAETSINYDHNLSFKIKIECDYVPIKLILKKYGYATIGVNNKLISRIIKENCDSMINDIDVLTKNDQQLRQDAFCRCINARLKEKNLERAMDIIHYLENDAASALYCYEGIINYIVAAFSFQNATTSLIYYMEILGCLELKIYNLLSQSNVCPYRCNNSIKMIKDLKSLYALKKYYEIDISLKDYHLQKSLVLQNYISKLLPNMKEDDWSIMQRMVIKVAELLGLEKSYAILSMLEQMKNLNGLEQFVDDDKDDLNMVSEKFKNIHKICSSILQHAAVDTNAVKVVKNLSILTLNTCQDGDLQSALMLYTCINTCPSFPTQDCFDVEQRPPSNWKLYTIYKDQAISLNEKLLFLFKDAMSLHLYYSNQINTNKITNCDEQMDKLLINFLENTRKIQPQHNDYSLLQIFKTFYFMYYGTSVRNEEILTEMKFILSELLINLLKKLCTGRSFDLQCGLSALFMLSEQEACSWLSTVSVSFQADYIRHCTISTLGYEYSRLGQNRLTQPFESYKLLHIWAQRLSHYSVTSK
ncbi:PREDICTED: uncharacterized protein LOC105459093, partial [Wasmannia auropunctata]|uniref:uncharacterized protein LOC105459093 n=1 Tax=Wasmannia auropunctata TaxID=64793 RepID=UPI0005EDAAFB